MRLAREDVEKVSLLARLRLSEEELTLMTEQMSQIVSYIDLLGEVDTSDVEPMAHAIEQVNIFAEDTPHESLPRDAALSNAPKRDEECFRVPAVLGE